MALLLPALIALLHAFWMKKAINLVRIAGAYLGMSAALFILNEAIKLLETAEDIISDSAIIGAIATFFLASWKLTIETWQIWKENHYKEEDIRIRREMFDHEKNNDIAGDKFTKTATKI